MHPSAKMEGNISRGVRVHCLLEALIQFGLNTHRWASMSSVKWVCVCVCWGEGWR